MTHQAHFFGRIFYKPVVACTTTREMGWYGSHVCYKCCPSIPIQSYCPPTFKPEFTSTPLNQKICGRGVRPTTEPAITLMWTQTTLPSTWNNFQPNHFVVCTTHQTRPMGSVKRVQLLTWQMRRLAHCFPRQDPPRNHPGLGNLPTTLVRQKVIIQLRR